MVIERTVVSPFAGGPIYQWLRLSSISFRRDYLRRVNRFIDRNLDFERMLAIGTPELHLDPHKNGWRYYVDSSYYAGMIDKATEDWIRGFLAYPLLALGLFYVHIRWRANDKYNVFKKWRKVD